MNFWEASDKDLVLARDHRADLVLQIRISERLVAALNESTTVARRLESLTKALIWVTVGLGIVGIGAVVAPFLAE